MVLTEEDKRMIKAHMMHIMDLQRQQQTLETLRENIQPTQREQVEPSIKSYTNSLEERITFVKDNLIERVYDIWKRESKQQ